jgi:hypothetical protein
MTTFLVTMAVWFIFSVPFGIACGTWMKRCDTLDKQHRNRSVSDVSLTRRRDDVNHAQQPEIK